MKNGKKNKNKPSPIFMIITRGYLASNLSVMT